MQACDGFNYMDMNYNQIVVKWRQKALWHYEIIEDEMKQVWVSLLALTAL